MTEAIVIWQKLFSSCRSYSEFAEAGRSYFKVAEGDESHLKVAEGAECGRNYIMVVEEGRK